MIFLLKKSSKVYIVLALVFLTACSTRATIHEVRDRSPDCEKADEQLKMLDEEGVKTHERVFSGVKSVVPSLAVVSFLVGEYGTNFAVATGEYEDALNAKIEEIKMACNIH